MTISVRMAEEEVKKCELKVTLVHVQVALLREEVLVVKGGQDLVPVLKVPVLRDAAPKASDRVASAPDQAAPDQAVPEVLVLLLVVRTRAVLVPWQGDQE
jgi:hypothetical protein